MLFSTTTSVFRNTALQLPIFFLSLLVEEGGDFCRQK